MEHTILNLLEECHTNGITISISNGDVVLKYKKGMDIDPYLLNRIKGAKNQLVSYFKELNQERIRQPTLSLDIPIHIFNNTIYYEITPTETYWIDDNIDRDFKEKDNTHGKAIMSYEIKGQLNLSVFKQAIQSLIKRHESLRTAFDYFDGRYFMKIQDENSTLYQSGIKVAKGLTAGAREVDSFIRFEGHTFNISQGPLFLSRMASVENETTVFSIKVHHVIIDTWSLELMIRDILRYYQAFITKTVPQLPTLKYQLKHYLACANDYRRCNYEEDKKYWRKLYPSLPRELEIPIPRSCESSLSTKTRSREGFNISNLLGQLNKLSSKYSTSLFVIVQAAFKAFMFNKTGQSDITIGTYVSGREWAGSEDQIGCFAKTVLIRTIFDGAMSFETILGHVKKSNEDMRTFTAFTLKEVFQEMIGPKEIMYGSFWKINIQFDHVHNTSLTQTTSHETRSQLNLDFKSINHVTNSHIQIDMHLQFIRSENSLYLFVDYDGCMYGKSAIRSFIAEYMLHLASISQEFGS